MQTYNDMLNILANCMSILLFGLNLKNNRVRHRHVYIFLISKKNDNVFDSNFFYFKYNNISLARTPEIGQGLGRILSCGARKPQQT